MAEPQTIGLAGNAAEPPKQMQMYQGGPAMASLGQLLSSTNSLEIHQKMSLLETVTQGICEKSNQYKIMNADGAHIMSARESSSCCTRCCCAPNHSTMVYIERVDTGEVVLSLERQGCQFPCPQKCLGPGPVCCECCQDGITAYEGKVEGDPGDLENAPTPIVMLKQPMCGGGMWPKLMAHPNGDSSADPTHEFKGPCIYGGCSELCMKATYDFNTIGGKDVAQVIHMTPQSCADVCKEICTDTDKFKVTFEETADVNERTTALAGSILIDYLFFEMDNGMLSCKGGNQLDITCCFCFCCGMNLPCKCSIKKGDGGGSGEQATE